MSGFLTRLLDRHLHPGNHVAPQIRGRFEPETAHPQFQSPPKPVERSLANEDNFNANLDIPVKPIVERAAKPVGNPEDQPGYQDPNNEIPKLNPEGKTSTEPARKIINEFENKPLAAPSREAEPASTDNQKQSDIQIPEKIILEELWADVVFKENGQTVSREVTPPSRLNDFIVKPAPSESGPATGRSSPAGLVKDTAMPVGMLKPPRWIDSWKSGGDRNSEIKVSETQTGPAVKINIGRIEVRAIVQQAPPQPKPMDSPKPKRSLDDFLNQRNPNKK